MVAPSQAVARDLDPRGRLAGRLHVIFPGVDADRFAELDGPAGEPPEVVVLGALVGWKRPDLALEAVSIARQAVPDLRLRVLGAPLDGAGEALLGSLQARAAQPDLAGAVSFDGQVPDPRAALARATCLLHCAPREPFGMAVLEALASARPVVVPDAGGPAEIVDPSCGAAYAPGDASAAAAALVAFASDRPACARDGPPRSPASARALRLGGVAAALRRADRRDAGPGSHARQPGRGRKRRRESGAVAHAGDGHPRFGAGAARAPGLGRAAPARGAGGRGRLRVARREPGGRAGTGGRDGDRPRRERRVRPGVQPRPRARRVAGGGARQPRRRAAGRLAPDAGRRGAARRSPGPAAGAARPQRRRQPAGHGAPRTRRGSRPRCRGGPTGGGARAEPASRWRRGDRRRRGGWAGRWDARSSRGPTRCAPSAPSTSRSSSTARIWSSACAPASAGCRRGCGRRHGSSTIGPIRRRPPSEGSPSSGWRRRATTSCAGAWAGGAPPSTTRCRR